VLTVPFDPQHSAGPPVDVPSWHPDYEPHRQHSAVAGAGGPEPRRSPLDAPLYLTLVAATVLMLGGIFMLQTGTDAWFGTMMLVAGVAVSVRDLRRVREQHTP
jgi:hypothetical protein